MSAINIKDPVVSVEWLFENLNHPDLIILDATIKKVTDSELGIGHSILGIPGARFIDIKNKFSNKKSTLPNMLLSPADFALACNNLGIKNSSKIVVYDQLGIYSSPRVWWMFKTMGHDQVAVLDGGLPEWIRAGKPLGELDENYIPTALFEAGLRNENVVDANQVKQAIDDSNTLILDARSKGRFNGTEPEPRAGLKGGHIPSSCSLPYAEVLDDGKFKSEKELQELFTAFASGNKKLIFTCGSGITACIIMMAAAIAGYNNSAVYDGSWSEWGMN